MASRSTSTKRDSPWRCMTQTHSLQGLAALIIIFIVCNAAVHYYQPAQKASHAKQILLEAITPEHHDQSKVLTLVNEVLQLIKTAEQETSLTVPCPNDDSLPRALPSGMKHLLAFNLHNNEDILPHNIISLIQLLIWTNRDDVFISVYESASTDTTVRWLGVLSKILLLLKVPHRIRAGGFQERRSDKWDGGRIHFLATVRNAALNPLWTVPKEEFETWEHSLFSSTLPLNTSWPADKVIFFNDVFFCHQHVLRLAHGEGDLTCSTDWTHYSIPDHKLKSVPVATLDKIDEALAKDPSTLASNTSSSSLDWPGFTPVHTDWGGQRCAIYDHWVARDINGMKMNVWSPYSSDNYASELVQQGRPFPVQCCWNGIIKFPAEPFRRGVRFRSHTDGECAASECTLLCHDLLRLGYSHFVMDPGVRVAYNPVLANLLHSGCVHHIAEIQWKDVVAQPLKKDAYAVEKKTTCCELKHNATFVNFRKDCFMYDPLSTNFTLKAIDTNFKPFVHSAFIQR